MNNTIKRRMKTTYNLIDHMKKYERYDYDMLMSCLSNLEHVYDEIFADIKDTSLNYISIEESPAITITNSEDSTEFGDEETVADIKQNAPRV